MSPYHRPARVLPTGRLEDIYIGRTDYEKLAFVTCVKCMESVIWKGKKYLSIDEATETLVEHAHQPGSLLIGTVVGGESVLPKLKSHVETVEGRIAEIWRKARERGVVESKKVRRK